MPLSSSQAETIKRRKDAAYEDSPGARAKAQRVDDLTFGDADPQAVADWSTSLVAAYLGRDLRIYCTAPACIASSGFAPPVYRASEPETICAHCGETVGARSRR